MLTKLADWIFNRALRLSAAAVQALARRTGQNAARITALNDAVAGIAANEAVQSAQKSIARL